MSEERKVVSIAEFLRNRRSAQEPDRPVVFINHSTGKISGSRKLMDSGVTDRLMYIRASIERINKLFAEIRELSDKANPLPDWKGNHE